MDGFELIGKIQESLDNLSSLIQEENVTGILYVVTLEDGSFIYKTSEGMSLLELIGIVNVVKNQLLQEVEVR